MHPSSSTQSQPFVECSSNAASKQGSEKDVSDTRKTHHLQRFNQSGMQVRSSVSHNEVENSVPGAAFNTTPIYDAQGSLVGLQAPSDNAMVNDIGSERQDGLGYMTMPPMYPYNVVSQPTSGLPPNNLLGYGSYSTNPQLYNVPYMQQRAPYYPPHLQQLDPNQQKQLLMTATSAEIPNDATVIRGLPKSEPSYDQCPTVCSLLAILFCPITLWCSVPALIYSMCAYTDYRAADLRRYQQKSDIARHLVITACVIGLLLCIAWAVLAYFYYELMLAMAGDVVRAMHNRVQAGL